jgi:hypothetical protein
MGRFKCPEKAIGGRFKCLEKAIGGALNPFKNMKRVTFPNYRKASLV